MIIFGILGLIIASYALWIENETRQNIAFIIGGIFLMIYSIHLEDPVFIVLQIIFIISASTELIKKRKKK